MSRAWYFVALVPLAIGVVIGVLAFTRLFDSIEQMPRLVAPGDKTLTLAAGDYVVYAESQSTVDGVAYVNDNYQVKCSLTAADGAQLALSAHGGKLTYTLGGFEGRAIFDFTMPSDGSATLACETDEGKAVLAIGSGFALSIVVSVVAVLGGVIAAVITFVLLLQRRKRYLALVAARDNTKV